MDQSEDNTVTTVINVPKKTANGYTSSPNSGRSTPKENMDSVKYPESDILETPPSNTSAFTTPSIKKNVILNTCAIKSIHNPKQYVEQTPTVVKTEARTLLKKLDSTVDDLKAAEDLHTLCLFGMT